MSAQKRRLEYIRCVDCKADEYDTDIRAERMVWMALKRCAVQLYKKPLK